MATANDIVNGRAKLRPKSSSLNLGRSIGNGGLSVIGNQTRQADLYETPANAGSLSSSGGSGSSDTSAADLAYLSSQESLLRDMLSRGQTTLNQGLTNLTDSYNRELGSANQQRSRALEDFGVQREDMTRGKMQAIGQVDTNARVLNNSLRQLLGQASGSGSSAFMYAAPNAVARQASGERAGVLSDYAENDRNVSLAERRAEEDYGSLVDELGRSRAAKESELRAGILESEQQTNRQLADLAAQRSAIQGGSLSASLAAQQPYQNAISERQSQIDSLFERFRSPQLSARELQVDTPQLRDYMVDRAGITTNGQPQQQYTPYSNFLRPEDEEE